jgi:hypothetical protein
MSAAHSHGALAKPGVTLQPPLEPPPPPELPLSLFPLCAELLDVSLAVPEAEPVDDSLVDPALEEDGLPIVDVLSELLPDVLLLVVLLEAPPASGIVQIEQW